MLRYRPEFYSKGHLPYPSSVLEPSTCILKFVVIMQIQVAFRVDEQPEAFHNTWLNPEQSLGLYKIEKQNSGCRRN